MNEADIRALPPEELNRLIAKAIGLHVHEWRRDAWHLIWRCAHAGCLVRRNGKTMPPDSPDFAGSYDASLATAERDGYDGPVAWLEAQRQPVSFLAGDATIDSVILSSVWSWKEKGPRKAAEDLAVVIEKMKEEKDA